MKTNRRSPSHWSFRALSAAALAVLLGFFVLLANACNVTTSNGSESSTGSVQVNWTVASSADATECTTYGAASVVFTLKTSSGAVFGTPTTVSCSAFSVVIPALPADTYTMTAQMVDATGAPVGTATSPAPIVVTAGETATQSLDFPASSFTTSPTATGTLVLDWTIASGTDPTLCTTYAASSISVQLTDASNNPYGTAHVVACSAFTTTIASLPPGTYGVTAEMLGATGSPVTGQVGPSSITITAGGTVTQPVDFPASSFTTTTPTGTTGTLVLNWTIDSGTAATSCTTYGAVSMFVQVQDSTGKPYGDPVTVACSAFTTTIPNLPPGTYGVTEVMVDAGTSPVSGEVGPVTVTITAGTTTTQPADFPGSSFTSTSSTTGSLTITWDVAGLTDPTQCTAHNANTISVQLYDSASQPFGTPYTAACSAFTLTIPNLAPGTYSVGAEMLDASSQAASTAVPPVTVSVVAGTATPQAFTFPANAFTN
jgi:hypothetical protein